MLRLGTRGSRLARAQAGTVAAAIADRIGTDCDVVVVRTEGDDLTRPLDQPVRPGAFVATLRDRLLDGHVDVVVHSYKDLPSAPTPGLAIAAVPDREDPADVLVSRDGGTLSQLPTGSRIGTSSPRRAAALRRARPDVDVVPIRGNVDSRLGYVRDGRVDAVVVAAAALHRLGRADEASQRFDPSTMLSAPAQGALAIECRGDSGLVETLAALDHLPTRLETAAERAVLEGIQASCTTAVGAVARWAPGRLELRAELTDHRGVDHASALAEAAIDGTLAGDLADAVRLGRRVAEQLIGGAVDDLAHSGVSTGR